MSHSLYAAFVDGAVKGWKVGRVSTLWGTLTPSDGRAGGCKQARFTPGVKRHARRASPAPCTVYPALTGVCGTPGDGVGLPC